MLCDDIRFLTDRALWETENLMKCIPDELWEKRYDGIPMWKYLYHTLYSMDRWYINPCDASYKNPDFHTETLADLNVVPKDELLTRKQLEDYFYQIRDKIQDYIAKLEDTMLTENPENCEISRFRLILGQFRHWHRHMGVIYGFIIEDTGKWPYVLNMNGKYPDMPMPNFYGGIKMKNTISSSNFMLVRLDDTYKKQLFEMMDEWCLSGEKIVPWAIGKMDYHDWENYKNSLEVKDDSRGLVPDSTYFCLDIDRDIFVGAVNIRHYLNDSLLKNGGHIGDGVRPSERRKGIATVMIGLALDKCRELGINRVLMVCDKENIASAKSIQNNGGIMENEINEDGIVEQRYWIEL